jgi:outer membrane protein TolC
MASQDGDLLFGVSQALPVMGKERATRGIADEEALTAVARAEARLVELRRDLSARLIDVALAERTVVLDASDADWLRVAEASAEALHRSGSGSSAALLRIRNDLSRAGTAVTTDLARLADARIALNRLLGRLGDPDFPPVELPDPIPELRFAPELVKIALNAEPRLRMARREIRESEARAEATRRSARPDLAVGVDTRQFTGDGGLREGMFTLSLSLPWFNRANYRRDLSRDRSRIEAARLEQADLEAAVSVEIHHLVSAINSAGREVILNRDAILPRSISAYDGAEAMWSAGRIDLREVLELRRQRVEAELRLANAVAAQWYAVSELLLCCGLDDLAAFQSSQTTTPSTATP